MPSLDTPLRAITANGLTFSYFESGSGPLVLLLHGFPDTPHTWSEVMPALAAAGYRVVAPFLRGYAPTGAPADGDYSALTLGGDIIALIEALGEERAIVIGHDWGAFAAYAAANLRPERMSKLIVLSIPHPGALRPTPRALWATRHFITFQFRRRAVRQLAADDFAMVAAICRRWSPGWRFTEADLAPVKECLSAPAGVEHALGYYWSFRRDLFSPARAGARRALTAPTSVPALAFFGGTDGALDPAAAARTPGCFTGGCQVVHLPEAGHFLHREAPQAFIEAVLKFIGGEP